MERKTLPKVKKNLIIEQIQNILRNKEYIIFAYLFGSFVSEEAFNDIDIGIFTNNMGKETVLSVELELEGELEEVLGIPVDIRVINYAPLPFRYNVLKERGILIDRNTDLRSDFETMTYKEYFDYKHLRNEYLKGIVYGAL